MPLRNDFADFVKSVEGKDAQDIIGMADLEATRAERCCLRIGSSGSGRGRCAASYARDLKGLIFYLRYRAKPPGTNSINYNLMRSIEDFKNK